MIQELKNGEVSRPAQKNQTGEGEDGRNGIGGGSGRQGAEQNEMKYVQKEVEVEEKENIAEEELEVGQTKIEEHADEKQGTESFPLTSHSEDRRNKILN